MPDNSVPFPKQPRCVLMFHGIGSPPGWIEDSERPYWIDWDFFDVIIELVKALPNAQERVVFTFDDGNSSDHRAACLLKQAGLSGEFFVLAGRIGTDGYLDPAQMKAMVDMDMKIGLHGRHHRNWRHLDFAQLEDELVAARKDIMLASGKPVDSVAIPFGAYNRSVMQRLLRDDFKKIYTSDPGLASPLARIVRRNTVKAEHNEATILAMIEDQVPLMARVRRSLTPPIKRMMP